MSDLDCNEFVELVTAFLDGALDDATEQRFNAHLALCDGCDIYLDQIRQTTKMLGSPSPEALPEASRKALLDAFRDWKR